MLNNLFRNNIFNNDKEILTNAINNTLMQLQYVGEISGKIGCFYANLIYKDIPARLSFPAKNTLLSILNNPNKWTLMVSCFFKEKVDGDIYNLAGITEIEDIKLDDLSKDLHNYIKSTIDEILSNKDECNSEHLFYYGFYLVPGILQMKDLAIDDVNAMLLRAVDMYTAPLLNNNIPVFKFNKESLRKALEYNLKHGQ